MKYIKSILLVLFIASEGVVRVDINLKFIRNFVVLLCMAILPLTGNAQQLQSYIQEATLNNPEVQALELRYTISEEKVITNDVVALQSPTSFVWMGRYDNVINSGGVKIFPEKVEGKLSKKIMVGNVEIHNFLFLNIFW